MNRRLATSLLPFVLLACSSSKSSSAPNDTGVDDAGADTSAPSGGCTVTTTGTSGVVLQGTLLMLDAPTPGELFVDGSGKIACVGASCASTAGYDTATVITCDGVISPGLINAHDHTEYATTGPIPHGTTRWTHRDGWRTGAGGEPALAGTPKSTTDAKTIAAQELRFAMGGATSVIGSGGVQGLLRNLAEYKNDAQLEGLTGKAVFFDTFPLGDQDGTELTSGCAYPKIRPASTAFVAGAYAPHIAEGINLAAENEMICEDGALGLVTKQTSIIHGVGVNAKDVDTIAKAGARLIWSARTNVDLYGDTAPITVYKNAGVTIGLGTDWLASGSMNMLRELKCIDSLNEKYFAKTFSDKELWMMPTKGSAIAAQYDNQIGELKQGLLADVIVVTGATKDYRTVIDAGVEDVRLVLRGGKPLYGDADLVGALSTTCSALDVCGTQKSVCLDGTGVTLADVQAVGSSVYPLFYCKSDTPKNEPSCVPYRDTFPNGTSATDRDGDGVDDTTDDCPDVFDPVRPMDGSKQSDVDGDGAGDACDAKPLDPSSK